MDEMRDHNISVGFRTGLPRYFFSNSNRLRLSTRSYVNFRSNSSLLSRITEQKDVLYLHRISVGVRTGIVAVT
jgi:hypothetical protein